MMWWSWISNALGVLSTASWSVSFYPQAILNARRRTVSGLSLDFLHLNPLGFACYTAFTASLLFSPVVREEYRGRHGGHAPQVRWNDFAFAIHAFVLSAFVLCQSFWYKRDPSQRVSTFNRIVISTLVALIIGSTLRTAFSQTRTWLDLLYFLSYIKLYVSFAKYLPQAFINYKRKSTVGWSIINILLDLTGGIMSLAQLVLDSWIEEDWTAITGNPGKLGLSLLSMGFDLVFVVQHFVLYRDSTSNEFSRASIGEEGEGQTSDERQHLLP